MAYAMLRLPADTRDHLRDLAAKRGMTQVALLAELVKDAEEAMFWEDLASVVVDDAYAAEAAQLGDPAARVLEDAMIDAFERGA